MYIYSDRGASKKTLGRNNKETKTRVNKSESLRYAVQATKSEHVGRGAGGEFLTL